MSSALQLAAKLGVNALETNAVVSRPYAELIDKKFAIDFEPFRGTGWRTAAHTALTAGQIRTLLSLVIGTNVEAWNANLDTIASLTPTTDNFIGNPSVALARPLIGLSFCAGVHNYEWF